MGESLSSDSVRARSQKQQEEALRGAAPDAWERTLPAPAERHFHSSLVAIWLASHTE